MDIEGGLNYEKKVRTTEPEVKWSNSEERKQFQKTNLSVLGKKTRKVKDVDKIQEYMEFEDTSCNHQNVPILELDANLEEIEEKLKNHETKNVIILEDLEPNMRSFCNLMGLHTSSPRTRLCEIRKDSAYLFFERSLSESSDNLKKFVSQAISDPNGLKFPHLKLIILFGFVEGRMWRTYENLKLEYPFTPILVIGSYRKEYRQSIISQTDLRYENIKSKRMKQNFLVLDVCNNNEDLWNNFIIAKKVTLIPDKFLDNSCKDISTDSVYESIYNNVWARIESMCNNKCILT